MNPKVLETCITILLLAIVVVIWRLESEKCEVKFPFVYFYDHQEGTLIDLVVPGLYFHEDTLTSFKEKLLKEKLKDDFFTVSLCLAEYMVYKNLERTPFGSKYYKPTARITHLGMMTWPTGAEIEKKIKTKTLQKEEIAAKLEDNIFKQLVENPPEVYSNLSISDIKLPPKTEFTVKRKRDKKGRISEILISMHKSLWFDMEIKIRASMGGIIGNWDWAKKSLKLKNKSESHRNDYYNSSGEIDINWKLKEWSIGHPETDFYRIWLTAISERLKNHFDWNLKIQALHIEAPFLY